MALFAGAGGGILGGKLLGWRTICAVEWEPYPASVLCARQNDGLFPPFPIWDDVQTFDGKPWRGIVDVVSGGFPCQDISVAGKGAGLEGKRSGMWSHMARVVGEVRPKYVFVENSPMLTTRGGTRVIGDLAEMGYDCKWTVMGAADVGANHQRDRIWILATDSNLQSSFAQQKCEHKRAKKFDGNSRGEMGTFDAKKNVGKSHCRGLEIQWANSGQQEVAQPWDSSSLADTSNQGDVWGQWLMGFAEQEHNSGGGSANGRGEWWQAEPNVGRVANGVAARVDRLKAIGNGQVPLCAATAWRLLTA